MEFTIFKKLLSSTRGRLTSRDAFPDFIFYRLRYLAKNKAIPSFRRPRKFSEKITCRMRYPHPDFTILADKHLARKYISEKVGDQYLPRLYLVTADLTEYEYAELPERFVMKSNHACGDVIRVDNRLEEDFIVLRDAGRKWLARDFSRVHREKQYEKIPRKLVLEEFLGERGEFFLNYRVHSFRDERGQFSAFCQFAAGRHSGVHLADWSSAEFKVKDTVPFEPVLEKPRCWSKVLELAEVLLGEHPYMRVDFYIIGEKIVVGELTLTPSAGRFRFDPPEYDLILGAMYGKEKAFASASCP